MEAQIALTGNVGGDVEFASGAGWSLARFRLGSTPRWRKGDAWVNGETTWITVRAFGQTAVNVRDSVRKGDPLVIVGKLRTRAWVDEAGQRQERLQVEVTSLGHDMARGVSTFVRPERVPAAYIDDEPLVPDEFVAVETPEEDAASEEEAVVSADV